MRQRFKSNKKVKRNQNSILLSTPCSLDSKKGFSIVEMLVATALFSMVMLVSVSVLVSIIDANRKAQTLQSVINNLNFAVEHMSRTIRVGTRYHCRSSSNTPNIPQLSGSTSNCNAGTLLIFEKFGGDTSEWDDQVVYRFVESSGPPVTQRGWIERCSANCDSSANYIPITAPEVDIDDFYFTVSGAGSVNDEQPSTLFVIVGTAGETERARSNFNIQTLVTQRVLDI